MVALTSRGDVHTLWSVATRSGEMRALVTDTAVLSSPRWGPDAASVYYLRAESSLQEAGAPAELWKVGVGAGGEPLTAPHVVRSGLQGADLFTLSRDGKRLAYTRLMDRWELWLVERAPGSLKPSPPRLLTGGTARLWEPTLSPDGRSVAFIRGVPGAPVVISLVDSLEGRIPGFGATTLSPSWSPDGATLAVSVSEGPLARVWTVRRDGSRRRRYPVAEVSLQAYKAVEWCGATTLIYEEPGHQSFGILELDMGTAAPLLDSRDTGYIFLPICSADGREVAFYRNGESRGLHVASTSVPDPVLLSEGTIYPSSWSDDSAWIHGIQIGESRRGLPVRVSRADGSVEPLLDEPPGLDGEVRWSQTAISSDGLRFVFNRRVSTSDVVLIQGFDRPF